MREEKHINALSCSILLEKIGGAKEAFLVGKGEVTGFVRSVRGREPHEPAHVTFTDECTRRALKHGFHAVEKHKGPGYYFVCHGDFEETRLRLGIPERADSLRTDRTVGALILDAIHARAVTLAEVARQANVSYEFLNGIIHGRDKLSIPMALRVGPALGLDPEDLLTVQLLQKIEAVRAKEGLKAARVAEPAPA